jgi:hypothetical protein
MFITDLSRGKIPYSEHFSKRPDYEQESLIQDLLLKDILGTRIDWINLGRDPSNLETCLYEDGDEKFISVGGVPYKNPMGRAGCYIRMVQEFPIYLLEPSNRVIGNVLGELSNPWRRHWRIKLNPGSWSSSLLKSHFKTN